MFQCVRDKLKTADEKLRNIGKHQSATVVQTQNFTFYKNQPKRENEPPIESPNLQQQQPSLQGTDQIVLSDGAAKDSQEEPVINAMEERVILRYGRREKNGLRATEAAERSDLKRRSRSEGPNRRIRQSMDEREGGKKQTYDGGGRGIRLQESSDSGDSDRNLRQTTGNAGLDSDSDSDPKKWTKNPLVVRRAKRSDKTKQAEKRYSGVENGMAAKNRDSWNYYGNEDGSSKTSTQGGGNSSSKDSGSSTKGSSKYQKLEEMRKKRINLAVTSDEENTPASRISRLRQRALQGALGDQSKPINTSATSAAFTGRFQWEEQRRQQPQPQKEPFIPSESVNRKRSEFGSDEVHINVASDRPHYGPRITPVNQPLSFSSQSYHQNTQQIKPEYSTSVSAPKQNIQLTIVKPTASPSGGNRDVNQQLSRVQQTQSVTQQNQPQKQAPARPPPPNVTTARQSFYTIPEPISSQTNRAPNNSSPDITVRRVTTQVRIPSAESIVTSAPKSSTSSGNTNQPVTFSNNLRQIQARGSPTPNQELFKSVRSPSQHTDVVEMRLKTTSDGRFEPQHKVSKKAAAKLGSLAFSDDTLDELIESNMQYLDSELDKAKTKRNSSTNVSRSSSLPDPRRVSSYTSSTPNLNDQPSIQVQASTSIQFHVSLPTDPRHSGSSLGAPIIQIAPSSTIEYQSDYGLDSHLRSQPDVVPRKFSYDSRSRLSRPSSEYYDRDDMSKSDSQLNAQVVIPTYHGIDLHPDQAYARGCLSDINLRADDGSSFYAPRMDKGMFSDVEYDIEVSERVKKWETFMKVHDGQISNEKKNGNLTTIQENNESEALMLPSEVRKTVLLSKSGGFGPSYSKDIAYNTPARSRPFSSDTSLHRSADSNDLKMFSMETNANRFIHVLQDPQAGPRLNIQSQSVTSLFHTPMSSRPETSFMTANELRQKMLANRQPALSISSGPVQATFQPIQTQLSEYQNYPQKDTSSITKSFNLSDIRGVSNRASRYAEELNEISNVKTDSVGNLRRRFDADSATATSEDDHRSVSTASAKLIRRPSQESPSRRESESVDWSNVLPGYESKFKDADVWSPNLESTTGVPVTIERVTARTLQTIPFSEDPFWKEIEEMTSFDPNSMAGHLSATKVQETESTSDPVRSHHQIELTSPHSSTLPNQPRSSVMPMKDRMQRSKSLYTPNITPLSINVSERTSSSAVSALDDVLEDISRSSMERKQLSPKKKAFETESTTSTSSGVSNIPSYLKGRQDQNQTGFKFEGGHFTFVKPGADSQQQLLKPLSSGNPEKLTLQSKQSLQSYQQSRLQQAQNNQPLMLPGNVNNYHLDPNLLKQKLLNTGLVVETDTEEPVSFKQSRSSSLGSSAQNNLEQNCTAPSFTSHSNIRVRSDELVKPSSTYGTSQTVAAPLVRGSHPAAPWAAKQTGTSALDVIQKALAPFQSTAYQPGPETLYGTSRLQSFNDQSFNTSKGPHTTNTSWTYQPQMKKTNDHSNTNETSSTKSLSRLQQVNASMDDLKGLAQNVERKINDIKGKLQTADEKSLDTILASLRRLTPEVKSQDIESINFDDYYTTKKSKLSDALSELNRIYNDLELNNECVGLPEREKFKPYRPSKSNDIFPPPQPKSEHLRPMQTRISSVFIPGLERKTRTDLDKETESEFDILSKSFQAIVDEVNQTSGLLSRATGSSGPENVAPETQKVTSKIALRSENAASAKSLVISNVDDNSETKVPPATAPKPQEKPKVTRFKSKLQESMGADDPNIQRARSMSVPGLDLNTQELLGETTDDADSSNMLSKTSVATAAKMVDSSITTTALSPASRHRTRVRPVRDNKIIQDDKATKKQGVDKGHGATQSPQPSPSVTRKIVYNSGLDAETTCQTSQTSQEAPEEATGLSLSQQKMTSKKQAHNLEDKSVHKSVNSEIKPSLISSPASQKKVPPPTAAKPGARSDTIVPTSTSTAEVMTSVIGAPKSQQNRVPKALNVTTSKSDVRGSNTSTGGQSQAVSNTSDQSKTSDSGIKHDDAELAGGQRAKRRLGTGVAMILDKFNTGEDNGDRMKKRPGTRSAPDLIESMNDGDDGASVNEVQGAKKPTLAATTQVKQSGEHKVSSPKSGKSYTQRPAEKRIPVLATDGNKNLLSKSTVVTSLERKVIDPEGKASSSGASTPQPSSPVSKPPQHPWKRQMSDPDKQNVSDPTSETSVVSPKFISKIPRPVTGVRSTTGVAAASEEKSTVKETENPHETGDSPKVVTRRIRPPDRKMQKQTLKDRPHSFHELISCFEKDPNRLQSSHKFRKYASADEVNTETLVQKVFRSEITPSITPATNVLGDSSCGGQGVVLKFQMKLKS